MNHDLPPGAPHSLPPRLPPRLPAQLSPGLRLGASVSLIALIVLCVLWETVLAPVRPGGTLLAFKALPLLLPLRGVLRGNLYTFQWASMLMLLYFMEGIVRATSDPGFSANVAWVEVLLSTVFFWCAVLYVRPAKRAHKQAKSAAETAAKTAAKAAAAAPAAAAATAAAAAPAAATDSFPTASPSAAPAASASPAPLVPDTRNTPD